MNFTPPTKPGPGGIFLRSLAVGWAHARTSALVAAFLDPLPKGCTFPTGPIRIKPLST